MTSGRVTDPARRKKKKGIKDSRTREQARGKEGAAREHVTFLDGKGDNDNLGKSVKTG